MTAGSRVVDALTPTTPDMGAVLRCLLGVLAMAALALAAGSDTAALWAAAAGAIAGAIALQDSPGGRVPLVVLVSLLMGAAVLLGSVISTVSVLFVVVTALWCFAAGMQWALGNNAGLVAAASTAMLVVAPPVAPTLTGVLLSTVLTVVAGCVQAVLITVWPPRRWRVQRDALTRAYRSLAADARRLAADRDAAVDVAPWTWLRDAFSDSQASRRPMAYQGGYRLPERLTATLRALRGSDGDAVTAMLAASAVLLDAIADHNHTARRNAQNALARLDTALSGISGSEAAAAQRFSQQLHEAAETRFPDVLQPDVMPVRGAPALIRTHMTWTSPILRHAVRLSAAVAVGVALDRFAPIVHGHWIALTLLMVLRPETSHTYTRCVGRLAGIAAGIAVASIVVVPLHPGGMTAAVGAVLCLALTYLAIRIGYIAGSAALAAVVVFLLEIDGATSGAGIEDRLFSVVTGGGLAVMAHVALPDHGLTRLRQRAGELLKSEIDYAATVVKAYVHQLDHPADALSAAWQRAFRARAGFEAASGAVRLESGELRRWLRSYRAALNSVTSACKALEENLPAYPPAAMTPEFVAAVDDYVDALRGAPANPATPWTVDIAALTAANQLVRERAARLDSDDGALRVLVAEVAAITRSLSAIVVTRVPTSAG